MKLLHSQSLLRFSGSMEAKLAKLTVLANFQNLQFSFSSMEERRMRRF